MMAEAHFSEIGLTLHELLFVVASHGRNRALRPRESHLRSRVSEIFHILRDQVIHVDALSLARLHCLIRQLVRFLPVLVDEAESFFVPFIVLDMAILECPAGWRCLAHHLFSVLLLVLLPPSLPSFVTAIFI